MILKILAMAIALFALIDFIVELVPTDYGYFVGSTSFVQAFFGLLTGLGIAAVLFVVGQIAVTIDKKHE